MCLGQIGDSLWLAEGDIVDFFSFPYPTRTIINTANTAAAAASLS